MMNDDNWQGAWEKLTINTAKKKENSLSKSNVDIIITLGKSVSFIQQIRVLMNSSNNELSSSFSVSG